MEKVEYERLYTRELSYWWNIGRRRILEAALHRHMHGGVQKNVLDVGCGAGGNILFLGKFGRVTGLDISEEAIKFSRDKGFFELVLGRAEILPFPDRSFDIVTALDCIEHIEDDERALQECHRVLTRGGVLLLTVPAHRWLWSRHDEALHHKRRYTEQDLLKKIKNAGFVSREMSHFVLPAIPFLLLQKSIRGVKKLLFPRNTEVIDTYDMLLPPPLNTLLIGWLSLERAIMRGMRIPFGSSLMVVARKNDA